MKILLTGATGFIGGHLCQRLVRDGHTVVALVRDEAKAAQLPKQNVELLLGDLGIFARTDLVVPVCDVVIHLAGVVAAKELSDYHDINFVAVQHLVECLERQSWTPKRLLFASSQAAAGPGGRDRPITEEDPCRPIDPYGQSKLDAETYLQGAPFPTTSFRPCIVLGPGDPASLTLFKLASRGVGFRIAGEPQRLSYVFVEDVVDAIVCMLADKTNTNHTYFVSHPVATDTSELWAELERGAGRRVRVLPIPRGIMYAAMRVATQAAKVIPFNNQLDEKQYAQLVEPAFVCSSAALRRELGWQPRTDLAASIEKSFAGYRAAGWL